MANDDAVLRARLEANTTRAERQMADMVDRMSASMATVEARNAKFAKRSEESWRASSEKIKESLSEVGRKLMEVTELSVAGFSLAKLGEIADGWKEIKERLDLYKSSLGPAETAQERLYQIAQSARVPIQGLSLVLTAAARAGEQVGASADDVFAFVEATAKAAATGNAGSEAMQASMAAVAVAINEPIVQMRQLREVLKSTPELAKALADGVLGAGHSVEDLMNAIDAKRISGSMFFGGLLKALPEVQEEFAKTQSTINQAGIVFWNAVQRYVGGADDTVGASRQVIAIIQAVSNNIDYLGAGIVALSTLLVGRFAGGALSAAARGLARFSDQVAGTAFSPAGKDASEARDKQAAADAHLTAQERLAASAAVEKARSDELAAIAARAAASADDEITAADQRLIASYAARNEAELRLGRTALGTAQAAELRIRADVEAAAKALAKAEADFASAASASEAAAAEVRLAEASVASAAGADTLSLAEQRLVAVRQALGGATAIAATAESGLTAAREAHTAVLETYITAQATADAGMVSSSVVARGLGAAWNGLKSVGGGLVNLLGGPWGAAMVAAGFAMEYLIGSNAKAVQTAKDLQTSLDELTKKAGITTAEARALGQAAQTASSWIDQAAHSASSAAVAQDAAAGAAHRYADALRDQASAAREAAVGERAKIVADAMGEGTRINSTISDLQAERDKRTQFLQAQSFTPAAIAADEELKAIDAQIAARKVDLDQVSGVIKSALTQGINPDHAGAQTPKEVFSDSIQRIMGEAQGGVFRSDAAPGYRVEDAVLQALIEYKARDDKAAEAAFDELISKALPKTGKPIFTDPDRARGLFGSAPGGEVGSSGPPTTNLTDDEIRSRAAHAGGEVSALREELARDLQAIDQGFANKTTKTGTTDPLYPDAAARDKAKADAIAEERRKEQQVADRQTKKDESAEDTALKAQRSIDQLSAAASSDLLKMRDTMAGLAMADFERANPFKPDEIEAANLAAMGLKETFDQIAKARLEASRHGLNADEAVSQAEIGAAVSYAEKVGSITLAIQSLRHAAQGDPANAAAFNHEADILERYNATAGITTKIIEDYAQAGQKAAKQAESLGKMFNAGAAFNQPGGADAIFQQTIESLDTLASETGSAAEALSILYALKPPAGTDIAEWSDQVVAAAAKIRASAVQGYDAGKRSTDPTIRAGQAGERDQNALYDSSKTTFKSAVEDGLLKANLSTFRQKLTQMFEDAALKPLDKFLDQIFDQMWNGGLGKMLGGVMDLGGDATKAAAASGSSVANWMDKVLGSTSGATDSVSKLGATAAQQVTATAALSGFTAAVNAASIALSTMGAGGASKGGLGSIISSGLSIFGGGGGGDIGSFGADYLSGAAGWANGGYTGAGPRNRVAGKVHKGEFVFDAGSTSRIGVNALEAMRNGSLSFAAPVVPHAVTAINSSPVYAPSISIGSVTKDALPGLQKQLQNLQSGFADFVQGERSRVTDFVNDGVKRRSVKLPRA